MGLFDQLARPMVNEQANIQQSFQNDLASLKANPIEYARAHGKTIPAGMTDPNRMVQHLLISTQVNNPRYQAAMRLLGSLAGK